MFEVALNPGPLGRRFAWLRELSGRDELDLGQRHPSVLSDVLARLLVSVPGAALGPTDLARASLADRDRLVAGLYLHAFGDLIESRAPCAACGDDFELGFSLSALLAALDEKVRARHERDPSGGRPDQDGFHALGGGRRFRLPTVADESALAGLVEEARRTALLERCLDGREVPTDAVAAAEAAMEELAPLLDLELPVRCALCGEGQNVGFDLVEMFSAAMQRERPLLTREVHALATVYRWTFAEIVGLPRERRRAHVEIITFEREGPELGP